MRFHQYLDAKRTVDDRALNRRVLARFRRELSDPLRLLEVGGGIGTMVERLTAWNCLPSRVRYTLLDIDRENVETARERLRNSGFEPLGDELRYEDGDQSITVEFEVADAVEFARETNRQWDAIVGHAVADLFDLDTAIPAFRSVLDSGGVCYFPITFDGGTTFQPSHPLDKRVERLYHEHMDEGDGSSETGRRLLAELPQHGMDVLAAGSSDWVVYPKDGAYPDDEAVFLRCILDTIDGVLCDHPDIDVDEFSAWLSTRTRQVEDAELVYVAHQLDVLGK